MNISVDSLNQEMHSLRTEMKLRDEKMEQLIHSGNAHLEQLILSGDAHLEQLILTGDARLEQLILAGDARLEQLIQLGDERNEQATRALAQKLDDAIEIRERLATIEARLPRQ